MDKWSLPQTCQHASCVCVDFVTHRLLCLRLHYHHYHHHLLTPWLDNMIIDVYYIRTFKRSSVATETVEDRQRRSKVALMILALCSVHLWTEVINQSCTIVLALITFPLIFHWRIKVQDANTCLKSHESWPTIDCLRRQRHLTLVICQCGLVVGWRESCLFVFMFVHVVSFHQSFSTIPFLLSPTMSANCTPKEVLEVSRRHVSQCDI